VPGFGRAIDGRDVWAGRRLGAPAYFSMAGHAGVMPGQILLIPGWRVGDVSPVLQPQQELAHQRQRNGGQHDRALQIHEREVPAVAASITFATNTRSTFFEQCVRFA